MQKYFFLVLFTVFIYTNKASGQTSDTTINKLLAINPKDYVNKPLDSLIVSLPPGYMSMKIYGIRNTARMLNVKYPNKVWIELHVRQFNYLNEIDTNNVWDIILMRK